MLKNPKILKRAHHEMDRVIGKNRRLEESDLPKLSYLQAICKETFRKHPSTPLNLPRVSAEACETDPRGNDFELILFGAGRRICAGTRMGIVLVEYILGSLVHSFDWKLADDGVELNMDESFGLALQKSGSFSCGDSKAASKCICSLSL
ncbi:hypothetical protein TEA_026202 [Camellia sinensis var. sinensis]|uniref:Uncharacterized protein n=1 Tax=Camellia sinensis var. sinensis TaxID=542762 RepID=A0A4V3WR93_CAMSN|nr:hypothetical protein TEA_026202 [Camellia sinensis var. sinensis]